MFIMSVAVGIALTLSYDLCVYFDAWYLIIQF